ncbi:unnamed protein product [Rodentolepis nana]|uniref:Anoctamin n=1 Tax=Rodentolepis nana TaxID=102285 RepID=A0A0R3T976_RODNA|nr:unnamed protein product [Rodentolepis nana]
MSSHQFVNNKPIFAKLHVQWNKLLQVAELLHFQKPIAIGTKTIYESFAISRRSAFKGFSDNEADFFTPTERILAIEYILDHSNFEGFEDDKSDATKEAALLPKTVSIDELRKRGVILALFPLHEPRTQPTRGYLLKEWASPHRICHLQPLDKIREYFGEKVAFTFAWIQFTIWSFLIIFIVALVASAIPPFLPRWPHSIIEEVCSNTSATFILCPTCNGTGCRFKKLKRSCGDLKWTYFFDSPASISLSVALEVLTDLISSLMEDKFSRSKNDFTSVNARFIALGISQVFNGACVCMLSAVSEDISLNMSVFVSLLYRFWITWSTTAECHRTKEQHVRSFLIKSSFMEFVNMYLSIVTGILVRGLNFGYPGGDLTLFQSPDWPVWSGLFGIFYEIYIKCTTIVFIKSAREWIPWNEVKERMPPILGGMATPPPPKKVTAGVNASESYKFCLDNYNLLESGESPLFKRQFDMSSFLLYFFSLNRNVDDSTQGNNGPFSIDKRKWACLIAFGSEFVNKVVYQMYYSPDGSMQGYANFTLSYMEVNSFEVSERDQKLLKGAQYCRYFGYRESPESANPYALSSVFWHILAAKFIFLSVFIVSHHIISKY